MWTCSRLAAALLVVPAALPNAGSIRSVEVRVPGLPVDLETRAGHQLDAARISRDVHRLWSTGRFEDVRVESTETPDGPDVVFRGVPRRPLYPRTVRFEPASEKRQISLPSGTPIDAARAKEVAVALAPRLADEGYPESRVEAELVSAGSRQVDLVLRVNPGRHYSVQRVNLSGNLGLGENELLHTLRETRERRVPGVWKSHPDFSQARVDSDLERLRALYVSRGYFDAQVTLGGIAYTGNKVAITYVADAGARYRLRGLDVSGAGSPPGISPSAQEDFPAPALCRCLMAARRQSETQGKLDFEARLTIQVWQPEREALLSAAVETAPSYYVGRIEFRGNHSIHDETLRRALVLEEGTLFDLDRLRRSLVRLNRIGMFEPLTFADVALIRRPSELRTDVTISLKQRGWRSWALSGPVGPASLGGPLQAQLAARLPNWGRGVLDTSTWYVSVSLLAFYHPLLPWKIFATQKHLLPLFALRRPDLPGQEWLSGFQVSPQLGPEATVVSYGAGQLRRAAHTVFQSDRTETPRLVVPIDRTGSAWYQGSLECEQPQSHWRYLRAAATFAVNCLLASPWL